MRHNAFHFFLPHYGTCISRWMCVSLSSLSPLNEHFAVDEWPGRPLFLVLSLSLFLFLEKYLMSLSFSGIMWSLRNMNSHFNMANTNSSESRACWESGSLTYENEVLERFAPTRISRREYRQTEKRSLCERDGWRSHLSAFQKRFAVFYIHGLCAECCSAFKYTSNPLLPLLPSREFYEYW